jgi:hypothetical protein
VNLVRKLLLVGLALLGTFGAGLGVGARALGSGAEVERVVRRPSPAPPTTSGYSAQTALGGTLLDGRSWSLRDDPAHGLCLTIATTDFGCDDGSSPGIDPAAPRKAVEGNRFPTPQSGVLVYGFLPGGASTVVLSGEGGSVIPARLAVDPSMRFWAIPIHPGANPRQIAYVASNGSEVARFSVG